MPQPEASSPARTTLNAYLGVLRRQWWLTTLVTIVAVLAGALYTVTATPEYGASMKVVVGQGRALFGADVSGAVQPFTQTMTDLLQSDVVARRTIAQRRLDLTPQQLLGRISVTSNPDTSVLQVTYRDTDAARARATLATVGSVFTRLVDERQGTGASAPATTTTTPGRTSSTEPVTATVFDPAHNLPGKVSPHTKRTIVLALLLGLIAGTLLAFLRDALSSGIRNQGEATEAFGAEVLAALPPGVLGTKPSQVPFLPPALAGQVGESVQLLAASLRFSGEHGARDGGVVVVTSARPEDGKSTVVAHLSTALARAGALVVAVEADLHRPTLHRLLDVDAARIGLTDVLADTASLDDALVPAHVSEAAPVIVGGEDDLRGRRDQLRGPADETRLELLPAGTPHPHPAELLSLGTTAQLVAELRDLGDYVVIDTPPVLLSGDSFPLLQLADRVIVVCREGHTTREEAQAVHARLKSLGVRDVSLVLTNSSDAHHHGYGYSYAG